MQLRVPIKVRTDECNQATIEGFIDTQLCSADARRMICVPQFRFENHQAPTTSRFQ